MQKRNILTALLAALLLLTACNQNKEKAYVTRTVQNPVLAGFYPDPSVTRGADGYYMVNSTFGYFPGIPIFYSPDLTGWRQIGHVLHRPEQVEFENRRLSNQATYAPAIEYHNGTYYVSCTEVVKEGTTLKAANPAGPWSEPYLLPEVQGIDPRFFSTTTGRHIWCITAELPIINLYGTDIAPFVWWRWTWKQ